MKKTKLVTTAITLALGLSLIPCSPVSAAGKVKLSEKNFPDKGFRKRVAEVFDKNGDGYLSSTEISKVKDLFCYSDSKIADITGIEYLTSLNKFYIESDVLKKNDFSKNNSIKFLAVRADISSIDLSKNTNLEDLWMDGKKLQTLDLSKNTNLKGLLLTAQDGYCKVKSLKLPEGSKLESVVIRSDKLESFDARKLNGLKILDISGLYETFNNLELGSKKTLKELSVYGGITSLDISKCPNLEKLVLQTHMTSIDLSKNKKLKYLDISGMNTEEIDISSNQKLSEVDINFNTTKIFTVSCGQKFNSNYRGGIKAAYSSSDKNIFTAKTLSKQEDGDTSYAWAFEAKKTGEAILKKSWENGDSVNIRVKVLYKDVTNKSDFWYEPTYALSDAGIVKGYNNQTEFRPSNECTRAQMVTFLWRLAGSPSPKAKKTDFKDVNSSDYFFKAVIWAVEQGITTGVSKEKFDPQGVCTRAQTVTFLWRMAGKPEPKTTTCKFGDVKSSDYFFKATIWASEKKIVAGYSDGTFQPKGKCLRRQMVTFLYKYSKNAAG